MLKEATRTGKRPANYIQLKRVHHQLVTAEKEEYAKIRHKAESQPDKYLSLIVDGMTPLQIPHFVPLPKSIQSMQGIKCTPWGILNHTHKIFECHLVPEYFPHGGNLTCTMIWNHLVGLQKSGKKLPPILHLQIDNCWKDNKNSTVLRFLGYLLTRNIFKEIIIGALPPGHTHEDIDQKFSVIAVYAKYHKLLCLGFWSEWLKKCFARWSKDTGETVFGTVVTTVWDWKTFLKSTSALIQGYSQARYFHVKLHNGLPTMLVKRTLVDAYEGLLASDQTQIPVNIFYPTAPLAEEVGFAPSKPLPEGLEAKINGADVSQYLPEIVMEDLQALKTSTKHNTSGMISNH